MIIDGFVFDGGQRPYLIAEASCNHNGQLSTALKLIEQAKQSGADAIKFQAYTADTITIDSDGPDFIIKDGPWAGRKLYELYQKTQTPFEWFPSLFEHAKKVGITLFASVFDKSSIDYLKKLDCPAYKIASMEVIDYPLVSHAHSTGKPVIISTGMATIDEYVYAADYAHAILHCVSGYPTPFTGMNLSEIERLKDEFPGHFIGVSDHSVGHEVPIVATALGASIIEKHFMLGDELTEDYPFSLSPIQFRMMARGVHRAWEAMQEPKTEVSAEDSSRQLRRSLYVVKDVKKGDPFTEDNVRSIRPSYGMAPGRLPWVLRQKAATDIARGTALSGDLIDTDH